MATEDALALFRRHGGRLETARKAFPSARLPWIDLSTGINPHAWRRVHLDKKDLARLPDPADTARLEAAAAKVFGCAPEQLAAVPGADIGLRLLPKLMDACRVAIVSPTYSGHEEAWAASGAQVQGVSKSDVAACDADVIVVVNPNNPDGAIFQPKALLDIAAAQKKRSGWLIVDESFADVMPEISVAPQAGDRLVVVRSFGKFFGLPGLRLGFVAADEKVIASLRTMTGEWPVSVSAAKIGLSAYSDMSWQNRMRTRLIKDALRLDRYLAQSDFKVIGGTSLFRLATHAGAPERFLRLARAGILVRPFDYAPQWLRFGIPGAAAWRRLQNALRDCP